MEGPTPVSALIHAATMVTAGVYLVARADPLFETVPEARFVVACIGGFTCLLAALIALTQTDLKRVLAYSTVSQLGYMFLALGSGALVAGAFHFFTHAFFKALLFLAAGSVMHAMGGVIDMRLFSGLKRIMPITRWTFLAGGFALAGLFPFAGFWSKDEILSSTLGVWRDPPVWLADRDWMPPFYLLLFLFGLGTAGLTAFYTFRAYFLTFEGQERVPHEAGHHAHESPPVMWVPLAILSVGAVGCGFLGWSIAQFLRPGEEHKMHLLDMVISTVVVLSGIGVAYLMYVRQPGLAGRVAAAVPTLYQLSLNKFYLDDLYGLLIVKPLTLLASVHRIFDLDVLDWVVDRIGEVPRYLGRLFRPIQNGLVQFYALAMILGLTVFLWALARYQ
jgi:NADH-quinone oxidoreductase subunit L